MPSDTLVASEEDDPDLLSVERLVTSETKYRSVVDLMAEGVVFQDADGRFLDANPAALDILGRSEEQMRHMSNDDADWESIRSDGSPFPADEHPAIVTLRTGEPQRGIVMGIRRSDGSRRWISINSQRVQLGTNGDRVSVLTTFHDVTDLKLAKADLAANIDRLEQLLHGTLGALATMVEQRDPYTHGHMERVAAICDDLAAELGWPDQRRHVLRLAAAIHDIGKIAVPFEILAKPVALSPHEMSLIRSHAAAGFETLRRLDFGAPIAEIVYQHHERMDGSGYPNGLFGDEIMPEARVLAIADVVESMATHRPYRPGSMRRLRSSGAVAAVSTTPTSSTPSSPWSSGATSSPSATTTRPVSQPRRPRR